MACHYRVKENEGSRTPHLYSLPCVIHRLFVSWQPLYVAIDGIVLVETRCRSCLLLVFTPYAPLSACFLHLFLFVLLMLPLTVVLDLYLVCTCSFSPVCDVCCVCRRGNTGKHGDAMLPRLRRSWRLGASIHPYRPLPTPFRALDVIVRTRYESLGGQHLNVAAIPGLSQEGCFETTRADFSVA